jgi:hypothetical protein
MLMLAPLFSRRWALRLLTARLNNNEERQAPSQGQIFSALRLYCERLCAAYGLSAAKTGYSIGFGSLLFAPIAKHE